MMLMIKLTQSGMKTKHGKVRISPVTGDDAYDKAYTIRDENQTR